MESIYSSCSEGGLIYGDDDLKPSTLCQAKKNMEEEGEKKEGWGEEDVSEVLNIFILKGCVCFGKNTRHCAHEI